MNIGYRYVLCVSYGHSVKNVVFTFELHHLRATCFVVRFVIEMVRKLKLQRLTRQ
jgi:hypothetical protein